MIDDEFNQYFNGRYSEMLKYYDDRAQRCQNGYHVVSVYMLVISLAISPILTLDTFQVTIFGLNGRILAAIFAPTVALAAGILTHFKLHENWLSYRSTWDALKKEEHYRSARISDYKNAKDINALFVKRVEDLISSEGRGKQGINTK